MSFINKMNIGNVSYDIQAGEKVQLTFPAGATKGTLTDEQLASLQANYQSCIEMVNDKELYTLSDNGHVEGYLTYSHVGIENSKATIKTLTITVSAKSFVIVTTVVPTDAGGKLYLHSLNIKVKKDDTIKGIILGAVINYSSTPITKLTSVMLKYTMVDVVVYKGSISDSNNIYLTDRYLRDVSSVTGDGAVSIYAYAAGTTTYPFTNNYQELFIGNSSTVTDVVTEL